MGDSRVRRATSALVALLALSAALTACGGDERTLELGESTRVLDDARVTGLADDPALTARLPVGELGLGWSDDEDLLASVDDDQDQTLVAPEGGALVAVAWDVDPTVGTAPAPMGNAAIGSASHELVLVSGGERTVLAEESEGALRGAAVAAVADPADLALEVTFDGVTQTVGPGSDEREAPAQADALYDETPVAETDLDCDADAFCRADAGWLPWVAGQGWAPEGELWPVVRVEARADRPSTDASLSATLDGEDPVSGLDLDGDADGVNQLLVFPAAAPASVVLEMQVDSGAGSFGGTGTLEP